MKNVLITGASSGIGAATARVFAEKNYNLILTARRIERLEKLKHNIKSQSNVDVIIFPVDLSLKEGANLLFEFVLKSKSKVDVLINNAGFGTYGEFKDADIIKEEQMLNLNIISLTKLTRLFAGMMISSGGGTILNIASTAAFQPIPYLATYSASKSYVLNFSEAIGYELKEHNVFVTAINPGPTQSEFAVNAGFRDNSGNSKVPDSEDLAKFIFRAMIRSNISPIYGAKNMLMAFIQRLLPRKFATTITGNKMRK
jgi:uncharacterized protein